MKPINHAPNPKRKDIMTAPAIPVSRTGTIVLWVLRILMAALFLFGSIMKLTGQPMMVEEFSTIGFGQWFRVVTGILELAGGVAVLIPSLSPFGSIALLLVDVGDFVAQVSILHMDWIHTIVVALILCVIIYLQRDQSRRRLGQ